MLNSILNVKFIKMRKLTMFITAVFVVFLINYILFVRLSLYTFLRGGGLIFLVLDNGKLLRETELTPVSLYIRSAPRTILRASFFFIWFLMTPDRIWLFKAQITAASWNVVLWLLRYYYHYCCGATEGSEQQHNQDLKEIYKGRRILEFITFCHNALHLTTLFTTIHCI